MAMEQLEMPNEAAEKMSAFLETLDDKDTANLDGILARASSPISPEDLKLITDTETTDALVAQLKDLLHYQKTMKLIPTEIAAANKRAAALAKLIEEKVDEARGY